jgi:hypothetical protein
MINLDDHKIFNNELKMDTIPLSIAKQAVEEVLNKYENTSNEVVGAMDMINKALKEIDQSVNEALKDD